MINFDLLLKNKNCACVPEGGGWVQDGSGVFSTNEIGICHFFADVKLFTVKMAKSATAACISHIKCAIVDFVSCKLFICNCFQILELASFNLLRFKDSARRSEKQKKDWQMSDYLIVI